MPDNFLTTREAARILGVSVRTAQLWVEKGRLEAWKTSGAHRRISRESVLKVLQALGNNEAQVPPELPLSVLIVEDDQTLLKLYRVQAAAWPFEVAVYTATNGYEGLVMVGEVRPRILLCDLRLPGVNGFQIIRALCEIERYRTMTIVVISALSPGEIEAHGGLPVRVTLMPKPVDFDRLEGIARRVREALAGNAGSEDRDCGTLPD